MICIEPSLKIRHLCKSDRPHRYQIEEKIEISDIFFDAGYFENIETHSGI